jgi:uracil phosphoribosyltransferase
MRVTVVEHPIVAQRLACLRRGDTDRAGFRAALADLGSILVYEASRDPGAFGLTDADDIMSSTPRHGDRQVVLVPVLRAGLGLLESALRWFPDAEVAFVGLRRDETTFAPTEYLAKIPTELHGRTCIVLDPMLATGGSLSRTLELLRAHGADGEIRAVCVVAAPQGLAAIEALGIDVAIVTAAIDDGLDDRAYIVPGLGDAGDRQFGAS